MSSQPSKDCNDPRVFTILEILSNVFVSFFIKSLQLQGITAPPPACLFGLHFCDVGGLDDALASPIIILTNRKK